MPIGAVPHNQQNFYPLQICIHHPLDHPLPSLPHPSLRHHHPHTRKNISFQNNAQCKKPDSAWTVDQATLHYGDEMSVETTFATHVVFIAKWTDQTGLWSKPTTPEYRHQKGSMQFAPIAQQQQQHCGDATKKAQRFATRADFIWKCTAKTDLLSWRRTTFRQESGSSKRPKVCHKTYAAHTRQCCQTGAAQWWITCKSSPKFSTRQQASFTGLTAFISIHCLCLGCDFSN